MGRICNGATTGASLLGLVYAGLVVLVLGVEARLQVVDERGGRHEGREGREGRQGRQGRGGQQAAHHLAALQQHARAARLLARRAPAPLRDLALDVQRAALRPSAHHVTATVTSRVTGGGPARAAWTASTEGTRRIEKISVEQFCRSRRVPDYAKLNLECGPITYRETKGNN